MTKPVAKKAHVFFSAESRAAAELAFELACQHNTLPKADAGRLDHQDRIHMANVTLLCIHAPQSRGRVRLYPTLQASLHNILCQIIQPKYRTAMFEYLETLGVRRTDIMGRAA